MSNNSYELPEGGVEVGLMALGMLQTFGKKFPNIVKEEHYTIAGEIQRELLARSFDAESNEYRDENIRKQSQIHTLDL